MLSSSSSSSSLFELYTPTTSTRGDSPLLGGCDNRGDSPLLGWDGDYDSENPLLFPSPGYARDLPQGSQEVSIPDLHVHPLALQHHRDSISVVSTHPQNHDSQELPLPLPASVIPQLQKRNRVSRNQSLGQVPQYATISSPTHTAAVQPTSPHHIPLPSSPTSTEFHLQSTSISSLSTLSSPTTPTYDVFNALNHSPVKSTNTTLGPHSRCGSAAASMYSLSVSLSGDSVRNAVYISDESDLEVLDYTLSSPRASVLDLAASEPGNTATIYVPNQSSTAPSEDSHAASTSSHVHHRIGSAFLLPDLVSHSPSGSEVVEEDDVIPSPFHNSSSSSPAAALSSFSLPRSASIGNFRAHIHHTLTSSSASTSASSPFTSKSFLIPSSRSNSYQNQIIPPYSQRPLSTGSTNSRLYIGPSGGVPAFVPTTPHVLTSPAVLRSRSSGGSGSMSGVVTSPETSPFAPSFAFSARESSGSSGGTSTSNGHSEMGDIAECVLASPEPTPIGDEVEVEREQEQVEDGDYRTLQSRWSVASSMVGFPSVPPPTPFSGSTIALPLPSAPKPSEEPSEYPMALNRAPTMAMKEFGQKGNRRSRRSSLVPFGTALRDVGSSDGEKEDKGKKTFKKAMMKLQGGQDASAPAPLKTTRKRASSSFGRSEGTSISLAIAEATKEYKDVPPTPPLESTAAPTISKRKRLVSFISRLSLNPSASHPNLRSVANILPTPPTPDFPTSTSSSPSPSASYIVNSRTGMPSVPGSPTTVKSSPPPPTPHAMSQAMYDSYPGSDVYPSSPMCSPTSATFSSPGTRTSTPLSPVSVSSCSTAMPSTITAMGMRISEDSVDPLARNPTESFTDDATGDESHELAVELGNAIGRHRHIMSEAREVNLELEGVLGQLDTEERRRMSISPPSPMPTPIMPYSPPRASLSLASAPRSPTKMRFAMNGTECEVEIPPVPLGPAPTPPDMSPVSPLLPSPIPYEFGLMEPNWTPTPTSGRGSSSSSRSPTLLPSVHIKTTPDIQKTPTKRMKFSTMLGLRGSRSESVLRLDKLHVPQATSPPPASPLIPPLSAIPSPLSPAPGQVLVSPPLSIAHMPKSPLAASSFVPPHQEREQVTVKGRPKSGGGGLRERFRLLGTLVRQQSRDEVEVVPPPVPPRESVGMAL